MPKLKQSVVNRIIANLNSSVFSIPDFDYKVNDNTSFVHIKIIFRHDQRFYFSIENEIKRPEISTADAVGIFQRGQAPKKFEETGRILTRESPGDYSDVEVKIQKDFDSAIARIPEWTSAIYDEIKENSPIIRDLEKLRAQFDEHIKNHVTANPDDFFTSAEIEKINERFARLEDELRKLEEAHSITKQELSSALSDIKSIKQTSTTLPKGLWEKITQSKFLTLMGKIAKAPEIRSLLFKSAEHLLIENDIIEK